MAWYPHARKRELPYASKMPARRQAKTVALHTNGGGTDQGSLYHWFARSGNNVASHFQVMTDGTVEQYISTSQQAYAQVAGNDHCVSIETEDGGHPSRPWTNAQIDSILGICRWLGVPAKVGSQTGDGIVWHSLFPAYNPHSHDCPGSVRVAQIKNTLIPELARGDDDMPLNDADKTWLKDYLKSDDYLGHLEQRLFGKLTVDPPGDGAKTSLGQAIVNGIWAGVERIEAIAVRIEKKLDDAIASMKGA